MLYQAKISRGGRNCWRDNIYKLEKNVFHGKFIFAAKSKGFKMEVSINRDGQKINNNVSNATYDQQVANFEEIIC